jgi:hypothetical protein
MLRFTIPFGTPFSSQPCRRSLVKGGNSLRRHVWTAPFVALGIAVIVSSPVSAQSLPYGAQPIDEHCRSDWSTREKWGNTMGMTWPQFLTYCRTHVGPWNAEGSPGPAPTQASATGRTLSECNAEYAANKVAIKASGQTKRAFVAACRLGQ